MAPRDYFTHQLIPMIPLVYFMSRYVKLNNPGWGYEAKKIVTENWPPRHLLPPDFEPPESIRQLEKHPDGNDDPNPAGKKWERENEKRAKDYITDIVLPWG